MLNTTEVSKSIIDTLNLVNQNFITYLPLIFLIFGLIGFIGNTITFLQPELRSNSCCVYLLCGSIIDIINLLLNSFPSYLAGKYGLYIPWYVSSAMCKFNIFLLVFLPHLSINFLLMAIIDRFAATCSFTSPIRRLSQFKMIPLMISATVITSCLASIYTPILYELMFGYYCFSTQPTTSSVLYIVLIGLMQPLFMVFFVWLTYRNILQSRRRVGTVSSNRIHPRNPFITMIFAQVFTTAFFSLQWIIMFIYFSSTSLAVRTAEQSAIVFFVYILTNNCYYFNNVKSFYLSMLTSRVFRQTFIRLLMTLLPYKLRSQQQKLQTQNSLAMTRMRQANTAQRDVATIEI